jgi:hypothetical protein
MNAGAKPHTGYYADTVSICPKRKEERIRKENKTSLVEKPIQATGFLTTSFFQRLGQDDTDSGQGDGSQTGNDELVGGRSSAGSGGGTMGDKVVNACHLSCGKSTHADETDEATEDAPPAALDRLLRLIRFGLQRPEKYLRRRGRSGGGRRRSNRRCASSGAAVVREPKD